MDPSTINGATIPDKALPGFAYRGWNASPPWIRQDDRGNIIEAELSQAFGDKITMRLAGQCLFDADTQDNTAQASTPAETFNPQTGQVIAVQQIPITAIPEFGNWTHLMARDITFQNDIAGNFLVHGVSLQPVFGWEYETFWTTQLQNRDPTIGAANLTGHRIHPHMTLIRRRIRRGATIRRWPKTTRKTGGSPKLTLCSGSEPLTTASF